MATRKTTGIRRWLPVAIAVVFGGVFIALQAARLANSAQRGDDLFGPLVIAVVVVIVVVAAVTLWLVLRSRARQSRLTAAFPSAMQFACSATPDFAQSARQLGARVSSSALGTVVIVDGALRFFVGGAASPALAVRVQQISAIEVGETLMGVRWTPAVEFVVRHEGRDIHLALVPISPRGALRLITEAETAAIVQELQTELRAEVLRSEPAPA
ncbi:hypothetical protein ACFVAJ_03605 [Agromyces sp. NPDC057679]|uniref:hypothetical protein n=1 Tax=Agromyces sp. NPDC057679 TaxID=3346207 RepID=UPI00366C9EC9